MEKIIISEDVKDYLDDLVIVLIRKKYFSYLENAEDYVHNIINFIYKDFPNTRHRLTPKPLLKHGAYFVRYNAGKRTAWYVFFNKKEDRYIIKYITNNHIAKAAFLKGLN